MISCAIMWDFENVKVPNDMGINYSEATQNIQQGITANLRNVNIESFIACGNSTSSSTTIQQRSDAYSGGADLADVPIQTADAADRELVIKMVMYARKNPPPAFMFLMTGDEDLFQILRRFLEHGYTNVLVHPKRYSHQLRDAVHYSVPSKILFANELHLRNQMRLQPLNHLQKSYKNTVQTVVYWDAVTCRIPTSLHHQEIIEHIRSKVLQLVGGNQIQLRSYFQIGTLPSFQVPGVIYIEATKSKKDSLHNIVFTDLVKSAMSHNEPENVILITGASVYSRALQYLTRLKVTVFSVMPESSKWLDREGFDIMKNSSRLLYWPDFKPSEYQRNMNTPRAKRAREETNAQGFNYRNVKRRLTWS